MAGDALARNSAADRAERERRITEENHAAENGRFLVELWDGIAEGPTVPTVDLHAVFSEMVRASFLRTGDLGAAQRNAFNDFWRQGFPRYPARDPDGNPFDPDLHLPPGINDRPEWQPDPEDAEPRPLPIRPEDGPYGPSKILLHEPRWIWDNGVWRRETPEEADQRQFHLRSGGTEGGPPLTPEAAGPQLMASDGTSGGQGGAAPGGEGSSPAGVDEPKPEFTQEGDSGEPEEAQAQDEPGSDGEDEGPEGAVLGADGTVETENILTKIYGQHGVDDETAATLAKTGVEPQIDPPELHEDRVTLILAINNVDIKDGKAIKELRDRIAKEMWRDTSAMLKFKDQLNRYVDGQSNQETVKALAPHAVKKYGGEIDPENAKLLASVMNATPENQQDVRHAVNKRFGVMSGGGVAYQAALTGVMQYRESGGKKGVSPRAAAERLMPYVDGRIAKGNKAVLKGLAGAGGLVPGPLGPIISLIDAVDTAGSLRGTKKQWQRLVDELQQR